MAAFQDGQPSPQITNDMGADTVASPLASCESVFTVIIA